MLSIDAEKQLGRLHLVTKFTTEQPLENVQMVSISMKPTYADHAPERYVVPGT